MSSNHDFIPSPPRDAQQRAVPRGPVSSDHTSQTSPSHPFIGQDMASVSWTPPLPPRRQRTPVTPPPRLRIQSVSDPYPTGAPMSFPEPQFYRATSHQGFLSAPSHRSTFHQSRRDNAYSPDLNNPRMLHTNHSVTSFDSSYAEDDHYSLGSSAGVCSSVSSLLSP